jgi:hypothetical protein
VSVEGSVASTGHSPPGADRVRALPSVLPWALALVLVSLIWAAPALASSGQITGTVTSASTGDPLAEVRVCDYPAFTSCAQTGPDGDYLLTGLAAGTYTVEFNDPTGHYLSQYFAGATAPGQATPVTVGENEPTPNVDAAMVLGGEVRGKVTSAATGEPLEEVEVCAENPSFGECATTDAAGDYAVLGLPSGSYTVLFETRRGALIGGFEYLSQYYNDKPVQAEANQVVVSEGTATTGIDAAMSATTGRITGEVRDARTGLGIEQIEVCAYQSRRQIECRYTDADGEYTIPNLPAGGYVLEFFDPEERGYVAQYYEGKETFAEADQVTVTDGLATPSIDAQMAQAPTAETGAASEITATGATLNATVNPNGSEVTGCELEYGTSTAYGTSAPCPTPPGAGTTEVAETVPVSGLAPNTEYHYRVSATSAAGTTQANDQSFMTLPRAPSVSAVSPVAGLEAGGTAVTITGTGFTAATAVRFNTLAATHYTVDSPSEITAESPAGKGKVDITVSTAGGTSATSPADQFSYVPAGAPPTISKLSSKKGPAAGGTPVIITGSHFVGVTALRFGSASARNVRVESETFIAAVAPPGTTGPAAVTVTTPNGTSSPSSKTTFTFEAPTVTALSPNSGSKAGGTHLTVTGSGFALGPGLTTFLFGNTSAGSVSCTSTTTCTLIAPAASKAGVVDVRAKVGTKTSKKNPPADRFTYG